MPERFVVVGNRTIKNQIISGYLQWQDVINTTTTKKKKKNLTKISDIVFWTEMQIRTGRASGSLCEVDKVKNLLIETGVKRLYILFNGEKYDNIVAWGNVENRFPGIMLKFPVDFLQLCINKMTNGKR